jgi:hypothetical protein
MPSMTEQIMVPGNPAEWREFEVDDYDPQAVFGSDEDELGALLAERTQEDPFGIVLVADPVENVPDDLIKRLAGQRVPTKLRRESHTEEKVAAKKDKKEKKAAKKAAKK